MNYTYPLDYDTYNKDEIAIIIDFLIYVEENLKHIDFKTLEMKYNNYRNTISSIKEEKRINKEFLALTGIDIYKTLRKYGLQK